MFLYILFFYRRIGINYCSYINRDRHKVVNKIWNSREYMFTSLKSRFGQLNESKEKAKRYQMRAQYLSVYAFAPAIGMW